jgi:C1A family cysteine protease
LSIINDLETKGPFTTYLLVNSVFSGYQDGIINSTCCGDSKGSTNHAVTMVGWGIENGQAYWLIRNSWGQDWGLMNGYVKILITTSGLGICNV